MSEKMSKIYKVKYDIQPGQYTKEELKASGHGGCDQVLICSVIDNEDGSGSYAWVSMNGHAQEDMNAYKKFQCMMILAKELSESKFLQPGHRKFCGQMFELYRQTITAARSQNET